MTHTHAPTTEQLAILEAAQATSANILIEALAGCGKSSTLEMIEGVVPEKPVLLLAFNKKIADDAAKRLSSTTTVRTFNSLGHRIWAKFVNRKMVLNPRKTGDMFREYLSNRRKADHGDLWAEYWSICQAVDAARTIGYVPTEHTYSKRSISTLADVIASLDEPPSDAGVRAVDEILCMSIRAAYQGTIDFTDQIYMPALFGGDFPAFPITLVDEYQDLNPLNHVMIRKLVGDRRLIGVGDPNQNIYGFRGAAAHGMATAARDFNMTRLPLSVSFRCPERIVAAARWRVPHFKSLRPGGSVTVRLRQSLSDFEDHSAVICRNNAPLFALAMRLLHKGRSVSVAGSEVGPKILGIMKKFGDESLKQEYVLGAIDSWLAERVEKGSKTAEDTAGVMRVFASYGDNLGQAMAYAKHLLEQSGTLTLCTGHRAKGLEWPTVYHLDPFLCRDDEQDRNLRYVIGTRSSDRYFEINSEGIVG